MHRAFLQHTLRKISPVNYIPTIYSTLAKIFYIYPCLQNGNIPILCVPGFLPKDLPVLPVHIRATPGQTRSSAVLLITASAFLYVYRRGNWRISFEQAIL